MSLFQSKKKRTTKNRSKELALLQEERRNLLSSSQDFFMREAYKTLRSNVNFSLTEETTGGKLIAVTSALQSEGKSFTAVNLAISYAQTDRRVLLVDCDLRRPKLSRLLQVSAGAGLSNLLVTPALLPEAIQPSGVEKLDVILSGDIPPNPSELLGSTRMERFLAVVKERYDYIILDTPPVCMVTDAAVLASKVDGVLFVVRAGKSERPAVLQAVDQLAYAQAKILGFVLNGVDLDKSGYGYKKYRYKKYGKYFYRGHGYGYGYGYDYGHQPPQQKDELVSK